jgi:hypothetical protein
MEHNQKTVQNQQQIQRLMTTDYTFDCWYQRLTMQTYEFAHGMELFSPIESCMFAMNQHACRRHAENFHIRLTLEIFIRI